VLTGRCCNLASTPQCTATTTHDTKQASTNRNTPQRNAQRSGSAPRYAHGHQQKTVTRPHTIATRRLPNPAPLPHDYYVHIHAIMVVSCSWLAAPAACSSRERCELHAPIRRIHKRQRCGVGYNDELQLLHTSTMVFHTSFKLFLHGAEHRSSMNRRRQQACGAQQRAQAASQSQAAHPNLNSHYGGAAVLPPELPRHPQRERRAPTRHSPL